MEFSWSDSYNQHKMSTFSNINFEIGSIYYNLSILYYLSCIHCLNENLQNSFAQAYE